MTRFVAHALTVGIVLCFLSGCNLLSKPSADFSVDPATGVAPLSVTFTNLSAGGGPFKTDWMWDFGDGSGLSSEQAPTHTYAAPGSFDVTLQMSTWLGKAEKVKSAAVVVGEGPTAAFDATPRTGTAPVDVQFTDASVAGHEPITGWAWDFGDGVTASDQNPKHTYTVPGSYTVKLTVTAGTASNTSERAGFIQVNPAAGNTPTMTRTFSSAQYVPGSTLDVTLVLDYPATDITALGITEQIPAGWTFQGVVGGTAPSLSHIDPATGALELLYVTIPAFPFGLTYRLQVPAAAAGVQTFSGKVLYRTDGPQLETADVVSNIDTQPLVEGEGEGEVAPTAAFDATPRTGTAPLEVQFSDASIAGTNPITGWTWDFGDAVTSNEQNPRHAYAAEGTYTVKLTVTTGTATGTAQQAGYIQVNPPPTMARGFSGAQYTPGSTLDVTLTLDYPATDITALGITEQIPAGWTYQGVVGGVIPGTSQINPATGALELVYVTIPAFPFSLTYRLLIPAAAAGVQTFSGKVLFRTNGPQLQTGDVVSMIDGQPVVEGEGEVVAAGVYSADFSASDHGWVAGFADLPADATPASYDLDWGLRPVPLYTFAAANALYIAGFNHSDDLFMYYKRRVTGLTPNSSYRVDFQTDFLSPYTEGSMGIGGSPADSVYLKAGASQMEPNTVVDGQNFLRMNIDKGNQAEGGASAVVLGTIGKPDDGTASYVLLSKQSAESFTVTADAEGGTWLFFGTDSGYEGITSLYYTAFKASFSLYTPPPDAYNTLLSLKRTVSTGDSYTPGQTMDVTLQVDRVGHQPVTSLTCNEQLPPGWTFAGLIAGPFPETAPFPGDGGALQFVWTTAPPRTPFTLTYRVAVPTGMTGVRSITGFLVYAAAVGLLSSNTEATQLRATTGSDTFVSLARQVNPSGLYFPGEPVNVTLHFEQSGDQALYGLVGTENIPAGWTIQSVDGASPPPIWKLVAGGVEYGWVAVPVFPVEFTYHMSPPAGASGVVQCSGKGLYRFSGPQLETNFALTYLAQGLH